MDRLRRVRARQWFDVWGFLLFSHGWTWFWWGIPIVTGLHVFESPGIVFFLVGGLGVPLGGLAMTGFIEGRPGLRSLWHRLTVPGLRSWQMWLVVLTLWLALALAGACLAGLIFDATTHLDSSPLRTELATPLGFVGTLLTILVLGPIPEEIGWRGYWLDRLQRRWSALTASLVIGVAWATWHAPLFVMVGYYSSWGYTPDPVLFAVNILLAAVLYTWVYNNTERSILAVVVFHFAGNATGQLLDLSATAELARTVVMILVVVAVVLYWGPRTLHRETQHDRGNA
jgi:membrane protease YdiL (CAAX protease family)